MSTITAFVTGDEELSRLLASAASCGWHGDKDVRTVADKCDWPAELLDAVDALSGTQVAALAVAARNLLRAFARPEIAHDVLATLIEECEVAITTQGVIVTTGDRGKDIAASAAVGFINLITSHGNRAAGICAWPRCDQPLTRVGRRRVSVACSPRCANRIRVSRHRHASP